MKNERRQSVWQREIILSGVGLRDVVNKLPCGLESWLGSVSVGLFILSPIVMAALSLLHRSIDYTYLVHPRLINRFIYPAAAACAFLAILIAAIRHNDVRWLGSALKKNPAVALLLLTAVGMVVSQWVNGELFDIELRIATVEETFLSQLAYFILLCPAAMLIREEWKKLALIRLFEFASLVLVAAALVLWNAQQTSVFFYNWSACFSSIYTNINYYGYFLSIAVSLSAAAFVAEKRLPWKGFSALSLAFNTVALIYCDTLGAWVACFAAVMFLLFFCAFQEKRAKLESLIAAALFAYSFILSGITSGYLQRNFSSLFSDLSKVIEQSADVEYAGSSRWHIWTRTVDLIGQYPVFGIGFEGVFLRDLKYYVWFFRPHNEVLQYALFYGIPTGVAYFVGCLGIYVRALRRRHFLAPTTLICLTAAFGYLVSSCFGLTLYCTAPFLFLFLGMGYIRE